MAHLFFVHFASISAAIWIAGLAYGPILACCGVSVLLLLVVIVSYLFTAYELLHKCRLWFYNIYLHLLIVSICWLLCLFCSGLSRVVVCWR